MTDIERRIKALQRRLAAIPPHDHRHDMYIELIRVEEQKLAAERAEVSS